MTTIDPTNLEQRQSVMTLVVTSTPEPEGFGYSIEAGLYGLLPDGQRIAIRSFVGAGGTGLDTVRALLDAVSRQAAEPIVEAIAPPPTPAAESPDLTTILVRIDAATQQLRKSLTERGISVDGLTSDQQVHAAMDLVRRRS